jgi:cytochrome c biogenesis protein CcmG, thiol:disulfide interchange protein DsbE
MADRRPPVEGVRIDSTVALPTVARGRSAWSSSADRTARRAAPVPWQATVVVRQAAVRRALASLALLLAAVVAGCGGPEVADFGAPPPEGSAPATGAISVSDARAPAEVPPPDADLFPGGWDEAAAFIAREADEGRPTLVNIFASWCGPCEREMPMLIEAAGANPDIAFLGIDHLDRLEDGREFVDRMGIDFPTIHDLDGDVAAAVGARGMPTTVVFDADGVLVGRAVGELTDSSLEALLDEVR